MSIQINVTGNLTRDFEVKTFDSGAMVANGSVAINSRVKDRENPGQYKDGEPTFFNLAVLGEQFVENVANSLSKGTRVIVSGTLRTRRWKKDDDTTGEAQEILVDSIGPDLRWAEAEVTKNPKSSNGGNGRLPEATEEDYALTS